MYQQNLQDAIAQAKVCESKTGLWTSLTVAQWALESAWGHECPGNNPFGITYSETSPGFQLLWTHEVISLSNLDAWKNEHPELKVISINGDSARISLQRKFARYPTLADAFTDHARLLTSGKPYVAVWNKHKNDPHPEGFIDDFSHIYATDPQYAFNLKSIIRAHNLEQFDSPRRTDAQSS